jgi:hypothetical protein
MSQAHTSGCFSQSLRFQLEQLWQAGFLQCLFGGLMAIHGHRPNNSFKPTPLRGAA